MIRLTFPDGCLTSAQLKAVAQIASEFQSDSADFTPHRDLRLRGIPADRMEAAARRLTEAGISLEQEASAEPEAATAPDSSNAPDQAGVYEQPQAGLFTLAVPVFAGRFSVSQMRKSADLSERYAGGSLQLAAHQKLLVLNVPKERVVQVLEGLEAVDFRVAVSSYYRGFTACAEEAEGRARELVSYLEKQVPLEEPLRIHLSGLSCDCGALPPVQIVLRRTKVQVEDRIIEVYDLVIPVQPETAVTGIPAGQLKYRLEKLLTGYKRGRQPPESFNQFCQRAGPEELARLLCEE